MSDITHYKEQKMNDLSVVEKGTEWQRMKSLVLDSVSSPITKRVYNMALDEFFLVRTGTAAGFYQGHGERLASNLGGTRPRVVVHHHQVVGHPKLAVEATDNGLLAPELAAGIARVKSARSIGIRAGNWLSLADRKRGSRASGRVTI
jgi:hypothetical protein